MLSIEKSVLIWELARVQTDWHVSRLIRPSLWTVCHFIRGIFHSAEWILHHFLSVCFVCVSWVAREDVHRRYTLISVSSERRVRGIYGRCPLAADQQGLSPQGPWQVWVCVCVCVCKRERESVLRIWSCGFLPLGHKLLSSPPPLRSGTHLSSHTIV